MASKSLVIGPLDPECKPVVIGIDFGTAYSGASIVYRADPDSFQPCTPSALDDFEAKVPTVLLHMKDGTWLFGHDAESNYSQLLNEAEPGQQPVQLYRGFKMVLKDKNEGFEVLTAPSVCGVEHSLMDLVSTILRIIKEHVLRKVRSGFLLDLPDEEVQWVLTVPAIWNNFGKVFMRKAALKAGLISEEISDNLIMVLEPEGAALAVHIGQLNFNILSVGSRFMVLDCGGGTIDITVHEMVQEQPLRLKAVAVPCGGDWGGNYVNVEFKAFLRELLGEDLYAKGAGSYEMYCVEAEFDLLKKMYDPAAGSGDAQKAISLVDVLDRKGDLPGLVLAYNKDHPTTPVLVTPITRSGFMTMSKALMMSLFEPSLKKTVETTRRVLAETPGVQTIMLVGGFGSSKVVTQRIRAEFHEKNGVTVILSDSSPKPQEAIVRGAVYFGMHKNIIDSRLSPYTYGIAMRIKNVDNCFFVLVRKGEKLTGEHSVVQVGGPRSPAQTVMTWRLFCSQLENPVSVLDRAVTRLGEVNADCPLNDDQSLRQQTTRFMFGGSELKVSVTNAVGHTFQVLIDLVEDPQS